MAVTVPAKDVTLDQLANLRRTLANDLGALVAGPAQAADTVYRDVRPTDFNNNVLIGKLDNPTLTADVYANDIYSTWVQLGPQQVLGIYGFADLGATPVIDEITFQAGAQVLSINVLSQTYANTVDARAFFFPPIVYNVNEHVNIAMLSHAGATIHTESFEWIGIIAEITSHVAPPRRMLPGQRVPGAI
jgi:hypothetical protein